MLLKFFRTAASHSTTPRMRVRLEQHSVTLAHDSLTLIRESSTLIPSIVWRTVDSPTKRPTNRNMWQAAPECPCCLLICLLNYISSLSCLESPFVTTSDRYSGAAEANKGLRLLWPALPPVSRWYLLRALF